MEQEHHVGRSRVPEVHRHARNSMIEQLSLRRDGTERHVVSEEFTSRSCMRPVPEKFVQRWWVSVGEERTKHSDRSRSSVSVQCGCWICGDRWTYAGLLAVEDGVADGGVGIAVAPLEAGRGRARRAGRRHAGPPPRRREPTQGPHLPV